MSRLYKVVLAESDIFEGSLIELKEFVKNKFNKITLKEILIPIIFNDIFLDDYMVNNLKRDSRLSLTTVWDNLDEVPSDELEDNIGEQDEDFMNIFNEIVLRDYQVSQRGKDLYVSIWLEFNEEINDFEIKSKEYQY